MLFGLSSISVVWSRSFSCRGHQVDPRFGLSTIKGLGPGAGKPFSCRACFHTRYMLACPGRITGGVGQFVTSFSSK